VFDVRHREVSIEKRATVDLSVGKCPGIDSVEILSNLGIMNPPPRLVNIEITVLFYSK
jgi:hypothetical protein